jgi:hypothetical protein
MILVVVVDQHQVILQVFQEHLLLFDNLLNKTKHKMLIQEKKKENVFIYMAKSNKIFKLRIRLKKRKIYKH